MQLLKLSLFLQAVMFTWISHLQDPYSRRYVKAAASQMFPIWHNLKRRKLKEHTRDNRSAAELLASSQWLLANTGDKFLGSDSSSTQSWAVFFWPEHRSKAGGDVRGHRAHPVCPASLRWWKAAIKLTELGALKATPRAAYCKIPSQMLLCAVLIIRSVSAPLTHRALGEIMAIKKPQLLCSGGAERSCIYLFI